MKRSVIAILYILTFLQTLPINIVFAETKIKPDIRASLIHVKTRPMPTQTCLGRTQEEWIRRYVGYNRISDNKIKFYTDLLPDADVLVNATDYLLPFAVDEVSKPQTEEKANNPYWNAQVCAYVEGGETLSLPSDQLIVSDGDIPIGVKKQRYGWEVLSALLARGSISPTNGVYDMTEQLVSPDTNAPLACGTEPPGTLQDDKKNENQGENPFIGLQGWIEDAIVNAACFAVDSDCQCKTTKMVIEPDSTVPYAAPAACQAAGCKTAETEQPEIRNVDKVVQPDQIAVDSGGAANIFRPGSDGENDIPPLYTMIKNIFGDVMGIQKNQSTTNNQNTQENDASWSFTKEWEVSYDFTRCANLPHDNRPEVCKTDWLGSAIKSVKDTLQGQ